MAEQEIGKVTHYFNNINVAIIKLTKSVTKGDEVHFKGHTSDWTQKIASIQVEHEDIEEAKKGQEIGIKVKDHAREGDVIYKVTEDN